MNMFQLHMAATGEVFLFAHPSIEFIAKPAQARFIRPSRNPGTESTKPVSFFKLQAPQYNSTSLGPNTCNTHWVYQVANQASLHGVYQVVPPLSPYWVYQVVPQPSQLTECA